MGTPNYKRAISTNQTNSSIYVLWLCSSVTCLLRMAGKVGQALSTDCCASALDAVRLVRSEVDDRDCVGRLRLTAQVRVHRPFYYDRAFFVHVLL